MLRQCCWSCHRESLRRLRWICRRSASYGLPSNRRGMGSWAGRGALSRGCAGGRPYRQLLRMHNCVLPSSEQLLGSRVG